MRAFTITGYGQPLTATEVAEPAVGARDVLVDIEAAGLNQLDEKIRLGEFKQILPTTLPLTLGHDLAGTVLAVGPEVTRFSVGDRVYGRVRDGRIGTFAERIAAHEDDLALVPVSTTVEESASLPLVALTAWQALVERGGLRPGQKVLIHAGAGGVGTIAIQLAKHLGATVTTTAGASSTDLVRGLGADEIIDYRSGDFTRDGRVYDLVIDSLGGDNLARSLDVLKPGGTAIGLAGPPDPAFARAAGLNPIVRLAIAGISRRIRRRAARLGVTYEFLWMHASGDQLREISALVDQRVIRPVVDTVLDDTDTPVALAGLAAGGTRGKVVVRRAGR